MKNLDFILRSQSFLSSSYAYLNALWIQCRKASFTDAFAKEARKAAKAKLEGTDPELYTPDASFCLVCEFRRLSSATYHAIRTLWDRYGKVGSLMENDYGIHKIL